MSCGGIKVRSARSTTTGAGTPTPVPAPVVAPGASGLGAGKGRGVMGADAASECGARARRSELSRSGSASEPEEGSRQICESATRRCPDPCVVTDVTSGTCSAMRKRVRGVGGGAETAARCVDISGNAPTCRTIGTAPPPPPGGFVPAWDRLAGPML
jgi:hypothetical protein